MRAVVQRVSRASVAVAGEEPRRIGRGFVVLLGVGTDDGEEDAAYLADKIAGLRVLADEDGRMNRSLTDAGGEVLAVSQFTLYGDVSRGRRPSFVRAAAPERAEVLYERFVSALRARGVPVRAGWFGAMMSVEIHNDGPVTILLDSERRL